MVSKQKPPDVCGCDCGMCEFDTQRWLWFDIEDTNFTRSPQYCKECGRYLGIDAETGEPMVGPRGWAPEVVEEEVPLAERYTDWIEWTRAWQSVEKERPSPPNATAFAAWLKKRRQIILSRPLTEREKKEKEAECGNA